MAVLKRRAFRSALARPALPCLARHRGFMSRFHPVGVARPRVRPASRVWLRRPEPAAGHARTTWIAPSWTVVVSPRMRMTPACARAPAPQALHLRRHVTTLRDVPMRDVVARERTVVRSLSRVERVFTRHESRTEVPTVRVLRSTRIERHAAYPRVSVVLSRPPAPAPAAVAPHPAAVPMPPAARSPLVGPGPLASPTGREPLPPQELARVTDHVLAQLDRKVLSYRERHGVI